MNYETFGSPFSGYVTATLATFFVGRGAENPEAEPAGAKRVGHTRQK